jgi:acetyl esterase/lipase
MTIRSFGIIAVLSLLTGCSRPGLLAANLLAGFDDYHVYENVSYGPEKQNVMDVYVPESGKISAQSAKLPVIVFFYGGCWGGCETLTKEHYAFVAQALTAKGYLVVIPDYRRYPDVKFPQIIDDAAQTVEWVKKNIGRYGGDSRRLFLMGHSAGAQMAALLTLNERYLLPDTWSSLRGFVGLAGPYDFLPFTDEYERVVFGPEKNYPASQPVNFVSGNEPALLLLYGNDDDTVRAFNTESLTKKVKQAGGCVETHYYDGLDHAGLIGALSLPLQNSSSVLNDIAGFLDRHANDRRHC